MLRDKQEILRFFNLSLIIKLREIEQTKFDFSDSSFRAYGKVISDPTRKMVRETIGVFENFNEELAVIVSKEEATWERWEKTTSEDDWWSISVGDLAKKRWMEWKEIIRLLGVSHSIRLSMRRRELIHRKMRKCRFFSKLLLLHLQFTILYLDSTSKIEDVTERVPLTIVLPED